jgi:4a-hydroxytetrahydrobiopterin dehydratase
MPDIQQYDDAAVEAKLGTDLPNWVLENGHLVRRFKSNGWRASMLLANGIAHLAEAAWHHPDMLITWGGVEVRLRTHDADAITDKDFELAAMIEDYAGWSPRAGAALGGAPAEGSWRYVERD